jgi:divalent metal cation (Fe/Co/Zn/Cd) transporter
MVLIILPPGRLTEETSVKPFENIDSSDMLLRKMKMESELTILSENKLYSTALWLAIFTIVYNLIEGLVASYFGYHDETLALFGFGVDSFIEMISGIGIAHMIYRMRAHPDTKRDDFERTALRVTGTSFYLLAGGLIISAAVIILTGRNPETTLWGVVISVISIVVMLCLIWGKIRVGKALRSQPILADASCTKVCIYMSIILLVSSGLYELTHLPFIDAAGTLGLAWFSYSEGKECFEKAINETHCACDDQIGA